jgi:hypothetical protein
MSLFRVRRTLEIGRKREGRDRDLSGGSKQTNRFQVLRRQKDRDEPERELLFINLCLYKL